MMIQRLCSLCLSVLVAVLVSGCGPEERVWWSPKGDRAVVEIDDQLFLVGPDSKLGAPLSLPDTVADSITSVDWLPDGSAIVVCRSRAVATWPAVKELIPAEEAGEVEFLMPTVLPTLELFASFSDQPERQEAFLEEMSINPSSAALSALFAVYEREPARIEELLRTMPDGDGADAVEWFRNEARFAVSEMLRIDLDDPAGPRVRCVRRSILDTFLRVRCASTGSAIAVARRRADPILNESPTILEVVSLAEASVLAVAQPASVAFDWHPDGQSVVFAAPFDGGNGGGHALRKLSIPPDSEAEGPVDLVRAILADPPRLEVLPDGRILFASEAIALPRPEGAGHPEASGTRLFLAAADGSGIAEVPVHSDDVPGSFAWFRASPDGRKVAVVGVSGEVIVVELATGRASTVWSGHPDWQTRTFPAWRSADALSFAGLAGDPAAPAWMLWTGDEDLTCLSSKWPRTATAGWLAKKEEPDSPASDPE